MTFKLRILLDGLVFPECPRWYKGKLWFSDMHGGRGVMTVDPKVNSELILPLPQGPAGLGFLPDGRLLVVSMRDKRLLRLDPDGPHQIADLSELATGYLNDMVVDTEGRAYIGNFGFDLFAGADPCPANIVMVTSDGMARIVAEDLEFPNGMVISPDGKKLIVAETFGNKLSSFDISSDGSLSRRRIFADLGKRRPDGICLDSDGAVWVASPWTSDFVRVTEGGDVTHQIPVEGKVAVACMLGGEDRRTLFLMIAELTSPKDLAQGKSKGCIGTVNVETPGAGLP